MATNEDDEVEVMRRELKRCCLKEKTIKTLEENGFTRMIEIMFMEQVDIQSIQPLDIAERILLRENIRRQWKPGDVSASAQEKQVSLKKIDKLTQKSADGASDEQNGQLKMSKDDSTKKIGDVDTCSTRPKESTKKNVQETPVSLKKEDKLTQKSADGASGEQNKQLNKEDVMKKIGDVDTHSTRPKESTRKNVQDSERDKQLNKEDSMKKFGDVDTRSTRPKESTKKKAKACGMTPHFVGDEATKQFETKDTKESDVKKSIEKAETTHKPTTTQIEAFNESFFKVLNQFQAQSLWNSKCTLANQFFAKMEYEKVEKTLLELDEALKSHVYRIIFAENLSPKCTESAVFLHQLMRYPTDNKNISDLNDVTLQALGNLSSGHKEVLEDMNQSSASKVFSSWVDTLKVVIDIDKDLIYGSADWDQIMVRTSELVDFFSRLDEQAKWISKSFILIILEVFQYIWNIRNITEPWYIHGPLCISAYCLPLSELDFLSSKCFSDIRVKACENVVISLGLAISQGELSAVKYKKQFDKLRHRMEKLYKKCLESGINGRTEERQRCITRFINNVDRVYKSEKRRSRRRHDDSESIAEGRYRISERRYISKVLRHFRSGRYADMTQCLEQAENELGNADFKIQIAFSMSRFCLELLEFCKTVHEIEKFEDLQANLFNNLIRLCDDCSNTITKKMKKFISQGLREWVHEVIDHLTSNYTPYDSEQWTESMNRSKEAVKNIIPGVDEDGKCILQLYVHLAILCILNIVEICRFMNPCEWEIFLKLASFNEILVDSDLFQSECYSNLRMVIYTSHLYSLCFCIQSGKLKERSVFETYDKLKNKLNHVSKNCKRLAIPAFSFVTPVNTEEQLRELQEVVELIRQGRIPISDEIFNSNPKVNKLIISAVKNFVNRNVVGFVKSISETLDIGNSSDILLQFECVSPTFLSCRMQGDKIIMQDNIQALEKTTNQILQDVAEDHKDMMDHIGESCEEDLHTLINMLYHCVDLSPKTDAWEELMAQVQLCVDYFETLSDAGLAVSQAYVLLFLRVLQNFVATRNKLCPIECSRLLPYEQVCVLFCESNLLKSDAFTNTKYDAYFNLIINSSSAIRLGQILYYPLFNTYCEKIVELIRKAKDCGIIIRNMKQEEYFQSIKREVSRQHLLQRMLLAAALLYFDAGCYKAMNHILAELDSVDGREYWRMLFTMNIRKSFRGFWEYKLQIDKDDNAERRIKNYYMELRRGVAGHKQTMKRFGKTSLILTEWVDTLFQVEKGRPDLKAVKYESDDWVATMRKSKEAASYINNLSDGGKGISQAYLKAIGVIINEMLFVDISSHKPIPSDSMGTFRILLACHKLFGALETSVFSANLKLLICNQALDLTKQLTNTMHLDLTVITEDLITQSEQCLNIITEFKTKKSKPKQFDWILFEETKEDSQEKEEEKTTKGTKETDDEDKVDVAKEGINKSIKDDNANTDKEDKVLNDDDSSGDENGGDDVKDDDEEGYSSIDQILSSKPVANTQVVTGSRNITNIYYQNISMMGSSQQLPDFRAMGMGLPGSCDNSPGTPNMNMLKDEDN